MATAIETSSQPQAPSPPAGLLAASLIGSVYVLASLAVVLYAVPALWEQFVHPTLSNNKPADWFLLCMVELAAAAGLIWFGNSLAGANPPKGIRGGIFLIVLSIVLMGFIVFAFGTTFEGVGGQIFTIVVGIALIFGAFKLLTSLRGERWMLALEEQGWFHAKPFKRVLGVKVRRLTILGILLLGGSGIYALYSHGSLPQEWTIRIPFTQVEGTTEGTHKTFTLLKYAQSAVPVLLALLTLWFAYRAVNVPTFAEFLIATEAEMNKVSWTSRKRLAQDTVVVLVTTILMALFLLIVDLFWGWLLSSSWIGVLPPKATEKQNKQALEAKW